MLHTPRFADPGTASIVFCRLITALRFLVCTLQIRELLGGRVRLILTGSAPIASHVKDFLQVVFCCPVVEGYGLTETCAIATMTPMEAREPGHVGAPASCTYIKLVDVPEMEYTSKDKPCPRGEICMKGPNIFKGYWKNPEKTYVTCPRDAHSAA